MAPRATGDPAPWAWLRQVHGTAVHVVDAPRAVQGAAGDGLVTGQPATALAVFTADCAPVAFASPEGVIGIAHAGWRGLSAGILEATVAAMRRLGATEIDAALGPCIRPCCYEFGAEDLETLVARFGGAVRSETTTGRLACDLPAGVRAALAGAGAQLRTDIESCTSCSPGWFSHRARREVERQASVIVAPSAS
jgi:YfiH family protein